MASRQFKVEGYKAGDIITGMSGTNLCGIWANTKNLRFEIPLSKPILASNVTLSGQYLTRTNGQYSENIVLPNDNVAVTCSITPLGIHAQFTYTESSPDALQHYPVLVQLANSFTITFS